MPFHNNILCCKLWGFGQELCLRHIRLASCPRHISRLSSQACPPPRWPGGISSNHSSDKIFDQQTLSRVYDKGPYALIGHFSIWRTSSPASKSPFQNQNGLAEYSGPGLSQIEYKVFIKSYFTSPYSLINDLQVISLYLHQAQLLR